MTSSHLRLPSPALGGSTSPPAEVAGRRWHVRGATGMAFAIALLALTGWALDAPSLSAPPPSHQAMVPMTAVLVMLLTIGVAAGRRSVSALAATSVLVLAGWALAAHHGPWTFPPGRWLFYERVVEDRSWRAAVPSVQSAVAAILLASALLMESLGRRRAVVALSGLSLVVASTFLLSQFLRLRAFYDNSAALPLRGVSLWSALSLSVLSSAVLCRRLPDRVAGLVYGSGSFARAFQAATAAALVVPLLVWAVMNEWGRSLLIAADDRLAVIVIADTLVVASVAAVLLVRLQRAEQDRLRTLHDAAVTDELTGLANRRALFEQGAALLDEARDGVGVVAVDIDGLKEVNDRYGHAAGDTLLQAAAQRLRAAVRTEDLAVRLGGDEFVVLTPVHDQTELEALAGRIAGHLTGPVAGLPAPATLQASVGTAFGRGGDPQTLPELLAVADAQMYAQKATRATPT